ncbi:MAG: hypothetical protein JO270_19345, partial [Acidobacteriaceae bacterium]|nr:hypothetical protein [Acidobacteriaceae bacterium]
MKLSLLTSLITVSVAAAGVCPAAVLLPIEVMGANGTTKSVQVTVPANSLLTGASLWLQIHGLEYETEASVQVNGSSWIALDTANTQIQGLAKNYGGIGGGFSTLTMLVPLPAGTVRAGANTISFRFNGTDGNSSGFRVLAFNFEVDGNQIIPASAFTQDNPATWTAPSTSAADLAAGQALYQTASIVQPSANGSHIQLKAHCGDCHTQDGRDLKYFNYSNSAIYARALFHGLNST